MLHTNNCIVRLRKLPPKATSTQPKPNAVSKPTTAPRISQKENQKMQQNFKNRTLFHGDNLDFLRAMNSESIDLIATDPPFNKGKDFHATPDSLASGAKFQDRWTWKDDVHDEWVELIQYEHPKLWQAIQSARQTHSDSMGAFCCFLGVRLLAMHRILKPTGSIYLHCDQTANSYIRMVMDAIFGAKNFRNEIQWERQKGNKGTKAAARQFGRNTDSIFFYTKSNEYFFDLPYLQNGSTSHYSFDDNDGRGLYTRANLGNPHPNGYMYDYKGFAPPPNGWLCPLSTMQRLDKEGKISFPTKPGGRLRKKNYLSDYKGVQCNNLWTDIGMLQTRSPEKVGYPTQKPIALYSRIIQASCPDNGWVLDPFAGCATTCVAAEKLNRKWVGMDLWHKVAKVTEERLADESHHLLGGGRVHFTTVAPERTDGGETAGPSFELKLISAPEPTVNQKKVKKQLIFELGLQCQGCNRFFDHDEYLELDHKLPKSEGGSNAIENRTLLCGPCNRRKSNRLTLTGLQKENKKLKLMDGQ